MPACPSPGSLRCWAASPSSCATWPRTSLPIWACCPPRSSRWCACIWRRSTAPWPWTPPSCLGDQLRWQHVRLESAGPPSVLPRSPSPYAPTSQPLPRRGRPGRGRRRSRTPPRSSARVARSPTPWSSSRGRPSAYLQAALEGRRDEAIGIIRDAMLDDVDVADIMLGILQPAQIELGRLWERGEISIAHEHYTTAITQLSLVPALPAAAAEPHPARPQPGGDQRRVGGPRGRDPDDRRPDGAGRLAHDLPRRRRPARRCHRTAWPSTAPTCWPSPPPWPVTSAGAGADRGAARRPALPAASGSWSVAVPSRSTRGSRAEVGADGWAPGAREALELCRSWTEDRVRAG